jgi:hypothetical protein
VEEFHKAVALERAGGQTGAAAAAQRVRGGDRRRGLVRMEGRGRRPSERVRVGWVEVLTRARLGLVGRIGPAGPAGLSPLPGHLAIYFIRINHLKE